MKKDADWHARRLTGIGGSDANIIMGGDNSAILRLWREKRGEVEPENLDWVLPVQIGVATEELNAQWFEHETGLKVISRNFMAVHPTIPYMRCELDGTIFGGATILECKHVNAFGDPADALTRYYPQLTHNMIVALASKAHLSIFHGTQKWVKFTVDLDPFYAETLLERERLFWECVQSGEPPCELPPVAIPKPAEEMREVDLSSSNVFGDFAADWLENKSAAKKFEKAEASLKKLVEPDVKRAFNGQIEIKRSKSGSLTIKEKK